MFFVSPFVWADDGSIQKRGEEEEYIWMNFPNPTQNEATPGRSQGMRIIGAEAPNQQPL